MASVVVIGIGSSGLHIIEQAQQFHYEFTGKNKPDSVEYLYIETDTNATPGLNPLGETAIERCFIDIQNATAAITNLKAKTNIDNHWIPSTVTVSNVTVGAGGMSTYGRCALWLSLTNVLNKISTAYTKVGGSPETFFLVVGSLTGGTGSGLILDIPYLINHRTQNTNIYGLMLLPNKETPIGDSYLSLFVNSYLSLASIENFTKASHVKFSVKYPTGDTISSLDRPYKSIQFLSQDFANGAASLSSLPDLYTMSGLSLVLRIIGVTNPANQPTNLFMPTMERRYVDVATTVGEDLKYSSCGMLLIQYPKAKLEELVAIDIVRDNLLKRWIDSNNYIDINGVLQSIKGLNNSIERQSSDDLEKVITDAINSAKGRQLLGKSNVSTCINDDISQIIEGTTKRISNTHFMYQSFASDTNGNYFQAIDNQTIDLRDQLTKSILSLVDSKTELYQNLYVTDKYIEYFCSSIEKLKNFWRREYGLTGESNTWNKTLSSISEKVDNFVFTSLIQKENYLKNLFSDTVDLLYFDRLIGVLETISENLKQPSLALATNDNVILPSQKAISNIIQNILSLLDSSTTANSLTSNYNSVLANINNNSFSQIIRLFEYGSCKADLERALIKYNNSGSKIPYKDLTGGTSLWKYLFSNPNLYVDSLKHGIRFVKKQNLLGDIDISILMNNIQPSHPKYKVLHTIKTDSQLNVSKLLPAMVPINTSEDFFKEHHCLKLIYMSSNKQSIQNVLEPTAYRATGGDEFCELAELGNCFIAYQEYGYMNSNILFSPLNQLIYKQTAFIKIKDVIEDNPDLFQEKRLPYINLDTFKNYI